MPYHWSAPPQGAENEITLTLWPHRSLPRRGFAAFVLATFALICIPLLPLLGTVVLWGMLPFLLLAVGGIWWALETTYRSARMSEVLTLGPQEVHLRRIEAKGGERDWHCNRYWVRVHMHATGGPVTHYVTLAGNGREVEIGAFLSEDERKGLYDDLSRVLTAAPRAG
ncbi:MAG: DUF2244 domain-containing protein [Roseovarius sp.]|nr:DUF2244 domain-containing protein [Roseovarius sp.]